MVTPAPPREHRRPIDTFFASLAEDCGDKAVGIVLSGVGSDGALGVRMIKEHGGLTLAQAEFDHVAQGGMPQSAADTGMVDHVVPVEAMPALLVDHQHHLGAVAERKDGDGTRTDVETAPGGDYRAPARGHRPRFQRIQGEHLDPAHPAPHAGAAY